VYHLFERKYTGLANKNGGDFKGDAAFIFSTFVNNSKDNPEASIEHNIIEMSEVNVTGWGTYEACNAPGSKGLFNCPASQTDYCCDAAQPRTRTSLPGISVTSGWKWKGKFDAEQLGFWYSFPKESQQVTWTEKVLRRITGKCLGNAWRKEAGGCPDCGEELDKCVAECIQASLCAHGSLVRLQEIWDRVFDEPIQCPDVPFPILPTPTPTTTPAPTPGPSSGLLPPWAWTIIILLAISFVILIVGLLLYRRRNQYRARDEDSYPAAQLITPTP